jgi:hypothetical protein
VLRHAARDPFLLQVRVPKALVKETDHVAIDLEITRAAAVALLRAEALEARRARSAEREE